MINYLSILLLLFLYQPLIAQESLSQTEKRILRVGYTSAPPFIIQDGNRLEGINIWLWERVAQDLGLEYEIVQMGFSDMLDSLKTGGIDVSVNPLTITSERSKHMEFTHSFFASNSTIAISETSSLQKLTQFLHGFFNRNFIKGIGVLLIIIFLFGISAWFFERKKNPLHFRPGPKGIWDGLWWAAVTLTTVGYGDKAPKSKSGKITALMLMFGGLLFISGLTASIASSLTVNKLTSSPDSFNEFKELPVGSIRNSSANGFLKDHFFKDIRTYDGVTLGLLDLKNKKIDAFLYDEPILKYRIKKDSSLVNIQLLPVKFDVQFYAFGLPKDKIALEQFISQKILEIIETQEWQIILNEYGLTEI
ncbi:MAG: transporter substrate-binding domain-containing protein [Bacteroidota bacterium]